MPASHAASVFSHVCLILTSMFFMVGGLLHLMRPEFFIKIMPGYLPWHAQLVFVSGVAELVGAILIWIRPLRVWTGLMLIALCILVFPANVNMAINHTRFSSIPLWLLYLRLPLQAVIIYVIYRAIRPELNSRWFF